MVTMDQVRRGIERYIDAEILPQLTGFKRYATAVYIELALNQAEETLIGFVHRPAIEMLGLMDGDDRIDIDRIRTVAGNRMASEGRVEVDIPVLGKFVFNTGDIEKLC